MGDAGVVIKTTNGGTNWINVPNPSGQYGGLMWSICPVDSEVVYAVAGYDFIMKTSNSGKVWKTQYSGIYMEGSINSLFFYNNQIGWAGGDEGLLKTNNGGFMLN